MANNLVYHLSRAGQLRRAEEAWRRVRRAAGAEALPAASAVAINMARVYLDMGRPEEARATLEPALEQKLRQGDRRGAAFATLARATIACRDGESGCESWLALSRERLGAFLPPTNSSWAQLDYLRGEAALRRGRAAEAIGHLGPALERFEAAKDRSPIRIRALSAMALAQRAAGRPQEAAAAAQKAVEAARAATQGLPHSEWVGTSLLVQAEVLAASDPAGALRSAEEARAQLAESVGWASIPHETADRLVARLRPLVAGFQPGLR